MVEDAEACHDIVSEAIAQTLSRIEAIEPEKLKNYVYTLIHHKCVDHMRHKMAANRYVTFYLELYGMQMQEDEWEEHEHLINKVMGLLDKLSDRTRLVLELCFFHRKRYAEVAEELGISVSGVKKHIVTALKTLRAELKVRRE